MDIANATSLKRKNRSMATNYDCSRMLRFRAATETPIHADQGDGGPARVHASKRSQRTSVSSLTLRLSHESNSTTTDVEEMCAETNSDGVVSNNDDDYDNDGGDRRRGSGGHTRPTRRADAARAVCEGSGAGRAMAAETSAASIFTRSLFAHAGSSEFHQSAVRFGRYDRATAARLSAALQLLLLISGAVLDHCTRRRRAQGTPQTPTARPDRRSAGRRAAVAERQWRRWLAVHGGTWRSFVEPLRDNGAHARDICVRSRPHLPFAPNARRQRK
uniref:Uncharacterized protein n=1 Tax=Plectus sambesii TaxID=2011161 RepID=A0A914UX60_9BILA